MTDTADDESAEKNYDPFLTNKSLSYFVDTVLLANEMNMRHYLDKKIQYHFLLNSVRPRKRYVEEWFKKQKDDDLDVVMKYYKYGESKARIALSILSEEQLEIIRRKMDTGG